MVWAVQNVRTTHSMNVSVHLKRQTVIVGTINKLIRHKIKVLTLIKVLDLGVLRKMMILVVRASQGNKLPA